MKTNSYTVTLKQSTVMNTQLNLFGMEDIKKSIKKAVYRFVEPEVSYGDIYDEYIDFDVCSQTWN